ncbi:Hint domain-containing protein [Actibacterium pelagium]|uniref:Type I secretion protein n=1 Tax=Actibacterium pelagium TaxID=2029103 RepID=A0A917ADJ8_9RHOB|nr:Hint domain-containing protein [Actibacterium pelagium]GGE42522.1 type I secretion protein [Actibacterium pelagium]
MPFFTPGTLVETPSGQRPIQELGTGDVVLNKKGVAVQIRWKSSAMLNFHELYGNRHLLPVFIQKSALGRNLPERDMAVSQNTWLDAECCQRVGVLMMDEDRVPAKKLLDGHGIRRADPDALSYIHIHFDRHEIIKANGLWVECYSPLDSDNGVRRNAQRTELYAVFPEMRDKKADTFSRKPVVIRSFWGKLKAI